MEELWFTNPLGFLLLNFSLRAVNALDFHFIFLIYERNLNLNNTFLFKDLLLFFWAWLTWSLLFEELDSSLLNGR